MASATVRIAVDRMPAGRTVATQADGSYHFELLLPGRYTVTVEKPDVGRAMRPVIVEVDKDTQVDLASCSVTARTSSRTQFRRYRRATSSTPICPQPNAYRALTIELNRPLANRWSLNVSYALSKMYGNFELDGIGSSGTGNDGVQFNTSSFLQDGPGIFVEDTFRQGPLNQDRTHVLKVLGTYMLGEHVSFGTNIRFQSGQPWAAMGRDWWGGYRRFLEPAGSRRNNAWTNVDLLAAYRLPLMGKFNISLEARALNVFDTQTAIFRDVRQVLDGRIRAFTSTPPDGCFACYTDLLVQGTTQPNSRFGEPTEYAKPRRLLLSVKTTF